MMMYGNNVTPSSSSPQPLLDYGHYDQVVTSSSFWENGAMGLNPLRKRHNIPAPEGYRVAHTSRGQPYIVRNDPLTQEEMELIADEHARTKLKLSCSWDEIEREYGLGIRIYFNTNIIIILLNVCFCIIQLINILAYYLYCIIQVARKATSEFFVGGPSLEAVLFSSDYPGELLWLWRGTNILCIVMSFLMGPVYWQLVNQMFKRRRLQDVEEHFAHDSDNIIKENENISRWNRLGRYIFSYTIYFLLLFIQLIIVTILTMIQNFTALIRITKAQNITIGLNVSTYVLIGLAGSVVVSITNAIYDQVS
jgi:hypothetical protein